MRDIVSDIVKACSAAAAFALVYYASLFTVVPGMTFEFLEALIGWSILSLLIFAACRNKTATDV